MKQREQQDKCVLGTFQDGRKLVWLGESDKEGVGEEDNFGFYCIWKSLESFTGSDKADLHFKRLTWARDVGDLEFPGGGGDVWLHLEYTLKESTGFADGLVAWQQS